MRTAFLALIFAAAMAAATSPKPAVPAREIAVTFDDLPGISVAGAPNGSPVEPIRRMTEKLVGVLTSARVPAVAFVNEGKLGPSGAPDPERVALLRIWTAAGIELGNHTFGHLDRHHVSLQEFEEDVTRGEPVTRSLLEPGGGRLRWFRHPYLHTGTELQEKRSLDEFLSSRGYRIAPVTIDNSEWIFAKAYSTAINANDSALAQRVAAAYVPYMDAKIDYWERQSRDLFGREVRQILLVHANSLNADRFAAVLEAIRRRGYRFVTLDRALEDSAYSTSPDTFVGRGGISWLHRWAITAGRRPLPGEPRVARLVLDAAGISEE